MLTRGVLLTLLVMFGLAVAPAPAAAQTPGVTATEIKIGNTNPYSGPASAYGTIGKALGAYFKKVNDEGGINGRKINYVTYDDAYSPPKTVEMVRKLVEQDQVALLFQTLGTPTNTAIHKYMNQQKVPHIFVATGATKWNDPKAFPWTMGWQPNYQAEGRIYAQYILKNLPDAKIGILYQNDDYGKDYRKGLLDGLGEAAKKMVVLEQTYEVTDPTIDSQIVNLKNSGANVFYNVTIPKFAVQAIKKAHDIGWKPTHFLNNVSSSLGTTLKPAGLEASKGLITALYMKEITDPQWKNDKGFQDWVAWMKKYYPEGALDDQANAYAYSVAQTLVHVLKQCGNDLSRENVMRQAAAIKNLELPMLLPGIRINTSPTDFAPIEQEQLAKFDGERWVLFGELSAASMMLVVSVARTGGLAPAVRARQRRRRRGGSPGASRRPDADE
jgi:branched-chain amino acid transport system substrate-binding protein